MPSALLWASSAEEYFYFGVLKSLRAFQNPFFTDGVVTVNGSCCACFLRKQSRCGKALLLIGSGLNPLRLTSVRQLPRRGSL